jgi:hypothetical protein
MLRLHLPAAPLPAFDRPVFVRSVRACVPVGGVDLTLTCCASRCTRPTGCKARAWLRCQGARRRWISGICLCPHVWQPLGTPAAVTSPLQSPAVLLQFAGSLGCSVSQLSRMTLVLLDYCCLLSMRPGQVGSVKTPSHQQLGQQP